MDWEELTRKDIAVLCVMKGTNYTQIPGLDLYDVDRDAYSFVGDHPVIAHAPCSQWSKLRRFANENEREKELAWFCLDRIKRNGGIFEHPAGSVFFSRAGIKPTISIDQSWFGFPARKPTWLYFHGFRPLACPIRFDAITHVVKGSKRKRIGSLPRLPPKQRSLMPLEFCQWLVDSIRKA